MNRRTFLAQAGAAPLVFGLPELFCEDRKPPTWVTDALRKMKETGRYGIVLIVPEKKEEQRPLGYHLAGLVDGDDRAVHALLCEAVFVCVKRVHAEGVVCDFGDKNNRYLLDPSGKRVDADVVDKTATENDAAFTASFGRFLHGRNGERLRERADAVRKSLPAEVPAAVEQLDAEEVEVRERASATLVRNADQIMPFLADLRANASSVERRGRVGDVIEALFRAAPDKSTGPRLPFGCKIPELVSAGCGGLREKEEGENDAHERVACGMARASAESRRFMRWLSFPKG